VFDPKFDFDKANSKGFLPMRVVKALGIDEWYFSDKHDGTDIMLDTEHYGTEPATALNDDFDQSFKDIANIIERTFGEGREVGTNA